ncbi:hypothetical protein DFP72DRAFT_857831 [Ephemerocybe angulata]|uniref:Uncharacterized protein n=1 Tax=Ephemerocybe angulata TaxID=980116 RepID=A0A8H6LW03_9AGAR|nr:hypothetical protein DFP72DRAFT_857831 [Tulosesus angulatus]
MEPIGLAKYDEDVRFRDSDLASSPGDPIKAASMLLNNTLLAYDPDLANSGPSEDTESISSRGTASGSFSSTSTLISSSPPGPSASVDLGKAGPGAKSRTGKRVAPNTLRDQERRILDAIWTYGVARRSHIVNPTNISKLHFEAAQDCIRGIVEDLDKWDPQIRAACHYSFNFLFVLSTVEC